MTKTETGHEGFSALTILALMSKKGEEDCAGAT